MLLLVSKYGLSHVCAFQEIKNVFTTHDSEPVNFPYLDIYFSDPSRSPVNIEFYLRGAKDQNFEFKNLFEYLLWTALNG